MITNTTNSIGGRITKVYNRRAQQGVCKQSTGTISAEVVPFFLEVRMRKISVLGVQYRVYTGVSYLKDPELKGLFGYCSHTERKIVVGDLSTCDSWKNEREGSRRTQERMTLRHEVIHAFLNESGLSASSNAADCWARNEEMVDWIAIQYPKIKKAFEQLGCDN